MQCPQVSAYAALGPEACNLPLFWSDSPGSSMMSRTSAGPPPPFQFHSPAAHRALSPALSLGQWPVFLSSLPSRVMASPALPSHQDALIPARPEQLAEPKARTLWFNLSSTLSSTSLTKGRISCRRRSIGRMDTLIGHVHRLYIFNWHGFYRMYIPVSTESHVFFCWYFASSYLMQTANHQAAVSVSCWKKQTSSSWAAARIWPTTECI